MTALAPCGVCRRHHRGNDPCAFCARALQMSAAGALGLVAILALSGCGASEVQKPVVIQPVSPAPTPTATDATPPPPPPPTAASASASGGGGSRRQPRVKQGEPQPRPEDRVVPLYGCPPPPDGEFV